MQPSDKIKISSNALYAVNCLAQHGFEAFAVGGCVRDYLMNIPCSDTDITTNALPCDIKKVFKNYTTIDIGEKYGTIAVIIEKEQIEITTYRTDNEYNDSRHPASVTFARNLSDDLSRRDFTINAMAYNNEIGIVDLFGGQSDINNKLIRCVGNAKQRFEEDALRIMRAIRFASVLNFELEEQTKTAVFECADMLKNISAERLRVELCKLICGKNAKKVLLEYANVLSVFIPEIKPCINFNQHSQYHKYDVWEHIAVAVSESKTDVNARLAALFHDISKPSVFVLDENGLGHFKGHAAVCAQTAEDIMKRLCFSTKQTELIKNVIYYHSDVNFTPKSAKRRIAKLGYEGFELLLDLQCADNSAKHDFCKQRLEAINSWRNFAHNLEDSNACISRKNLAINGNDIISLGVCGKQIGNVLEALLAKVIDEEIENEHDALMNCAKTIVSQTNY